jgi:hypothetical protein
MTSALESLRGVAEDAVCSVERVLLVAPATSERQHLSSATGNARRFCGLEVARDRCRASIVVRLHVVAQAEHGSPGRPTASDIGATRCFGVLEAIEPTSKLLGIVSNDGDSLTCDSAAFVERVKVALE